MPLDGNGSWVPAGSSVNPAVTGTTINSVDYNALLSDIKTALSTAMFKDGQATPTANIKMGSFKFTGLAAGSTAGDSVRYEQVALLAGSNMTGGLNSAKTTVSSATTPDIFAVTVGNTIDYTGTTTCTGFVAAPQAGATRVLICAGAAVFTAGANMLIDGVTSGNNLTCAANDLVYVYAITTTQFRLSRTSYAGGSSLVLIQAQSASASATIDFTTGISSTYDEYLVTISDLVPATDATTLEVRVSEDGGSTFKAGGTDYAYVAQISTDAGATANSGTTGNSFMAIGLALSNTKAYSGEFRIFAPSATSRHKIATWHAGYEVSGGTITWLSGSGVFKLDTNAVNGLRFLMSSGNITAGNFALYGIKKS